MVHDTMLNSNKLTINKFTRSSKVISNYIIALYRCSTLLYQYGWFSTGLKITATDVQNRLGKMINFNLSNTYKIVFLKANIALGHLKILKRVILYCVR